MIDQAQSLRQRMRSIKSDTTSNIDNTKKRPKIITISSGKGGVGKSNTVSNLAISLTKIGKKVIILDADIGMSNIEVLLNTNTSYSVIDVIKDNKNLEEVIVKSEYGVYLISGGSGIDYIEDFTEDERQRFVKIIEDINEFDYLLIDTGAGINKSMLSFISLSDEFILITTPEPTAITDGYSLLKIISNYNIRKNVSVIINKSTNQNEGLSTFNKIKKVSDKFLRLNLKLIGCMSEDKRVSISVKSQTPFYVLYPSSTISKSIKNISLNIINNDEYKTDSNLFEKMFNVFKM